VMGNSISSGSILIESNLTSRPSYPPGPNYFAEIAGCS
jgi:hypothetical protein